MDMKERKKITQILGAALEKHLNPELSIADGTAIGLADEVIWMEDGE